MDRPATPSHPPYGGYHQTAELAADAELTHVGPGTLGGEYLRRFCVYLLVAAIVLCGYNLFMNARLEMFNFRGEMLCGI